ncbi:MAG TPA: hypothetical protein VKK19_10265 [Candidatus Dormibacteraeota bacterium]|nr:hypothetical protein [Candidatus Dormibacteraeota bacterium]
MRTAVGAALMNTQLRESLAGRLSERLADGHQILGRWAVALTASETYAEIFDQHVELYGRVNGLLQFLREGYRQTDPRGFRNRDRRDYLSPGGEAEDEWFVDNLTGAIDIGASLEDATWDLALSILPQEWWDRRTAKLAAAARTPRPLLAAER